MIVSGMVVVALGLQGHNKRKGTSSELVKILLNLPKAQAKEYRQNLPALKDLLRESEAVWTIATKDSPIGEGAKFEKLLGDEQRISELNSTGSFRFQKVSKQDLPVIINYLRNLPAEEGLAAMCFSPRNFIYAKKGKDWTKISICYECSQFVVDMGAKKLHGTPNRESISKLETMFGMPYQSPKS